ncbi:cell division cycle-related protein [Balamuthia mandrillaris]
MEEGTAGGLANVQPAAGGKQYGKEEAFRAAVKEVLLGEDDGSNEKRFAFLLSYKVLQPPFMDLTELYFQEYERVAALYEKELKANGNATILRTSNYIFILRLQDFARVWVTHFPEDLSPKFHTRLRLQLKNYSTPAVLNEFKLLFLKNNRSTSAIHLSPFTANNSTSSLSAPTSPNTSPPASPKGRPSSSSSVSPSGSTILLTATQTLDLPSSTIERRSEGQKEKSPRSRRKNKAKSLTMAEVEQLTKIVSQQNKKDKEKSKEKGNKEKDHHQPHYHHHTIGSKLRKRGSSISAFISDHLKDKHTSIHLDRSASVEDWREFSAGIVAREITMIEWDLFHQIGPREFLKNGWQKPDKEQRAPNICRLIQRFNELGYWIATQILTSEDKQKIVIIKKCIKIGQHFYHLGNFNGLMEVLSGLSCSPIARLQNIWKRVPQSHLSILAELDEVMSTSRNFVNYNEALEKREKAGLPTLPHLAYFLRLFTHLDECNEPFMPTDGSVNFDLLLSRAQIIRRIMHLQSVAFTFPRNQQVKQYFTSLDKHFVDDAEMLYNLSLCCFPRKDLSFDSAPSSASSTPREEQQQKEATEAAQHKEEEKGGQEERKEKNVTFKFSSDDLEELKSLWEHSSSGQIKTRFGKKLRELAAAAAEIEFEDDGEEEKEEAEAKEEKKKKKNKKNKKEEERSNSTPEIRVEALHTKH